MKLSFSMLSIFMEFQKMYETNRAISKAIDNHDSTIDYALNEVKMKGASCTCTMTYTSSYEYANKVFVRNRFKL